MFWGYRITDNWLVNDILKPVWPNKQISSLWVNGSQKEELLGTSVLDSFVLPVKIKQIFKNTDYKIKKKSSIINKS